MRHRRAGTEAVRPPTRRVPAGGWRGVQRARVELLEPRLDVELHRSPGAAFLRRLARGLRFPSAAAARLRAGITGLLGSVCAFRVNAGLVKAGSTADVIFATRSLPSLCSYTRCYDFEALYRLVAAFCCAASIRGYVGTAVPRPAGGMDFVPSVTAELTQNLPET